MVVTEEGKVLEGSVHVTGGHPRDVVRDLTEAAEQWTFVPARVDGCWVSSLFGYRIVGSAPEPEPALTPPAPP